MQTTIKQLSPVEYELDIHATAADLAPGIDKALREQQARTILKGFRPGKVPLPLVKKMYGKVLAYGVAEKSVQEIYEAEVLESPEHEVLGQPTLTTFTYDLDKDLHAVVKFGVRPEVELMDLSQEEIVRLRHEVTDEDVQKEIDRLRRERADLVPVEEEGIGEEDLVVFDLQEVDPATRTPLIGKRDEDVSMAMDDPRYLEHPMYGPLRRALLGARAGDTVFFEFAHDVAHGEHGEQGEPGGHHGGQGGHAHAHFFQAAVKEVKRRDLPELDEEFIQEATGGQVTDEEALRAEIRTQLERAWERNAREAFESNLMRRMLELHPVPVPDSVVEMYLDSFVEDVKRRNEGNLPDGFDEAYFRSQNRGEAEQQAQWMLLRDKLIEKEGLQVTEEDVEAYFAREVGAEERLTAAQLRSFYQSMPRLMEQLQQRLLSEKVFTTLSERFSVVEKDWEPGQE